MSIKNGIQNPNKFYSMSGLLSDVNKYNLWSADNTAFDSNDNSVVKTVYDPSPVGFKMPASNAFTGFTANGQNGGTMNVDGTDNLQTFQNNFGHNFWTNNSKTATINFPANGWRDFNDGSLHDVGVYGTYWLAIPSGTSNGCRQSFTSGNVTPLFGVVLSYGAAVRPVSE